jgi:splicing factor 3B subunit 4
MSASFGSFLTGATNYALPGINDRNQDATLYVGNLDAKVDEELVWELFIQCGPLASVVLPRDRVTSCHQGYAFVEYKTTEDAEYAIKILNMVRLFGKPIRCNKSTVGDKAGSGGGPRSTEVGANIFVGGLSPDIDEAYLQDTFSAFGSVTYTKIMRDPTMVSKGFGFVSFDSFSAADSAILLTEER